MPATTLNKKITRTWDIVGDAANWTLGPRGKIDGYGIEAGIRIGAGNDANRLTVRGDILLSGADDIGILDQSGSNRLVIEKTAEIRASIGIQAEGVGTVITNGGTIGAAAEGIHASHAVKLTNGGTIDAQSGIWVTDGSTVKNLKSGVIWADDTAVTLFEGSSKLINSGFLSGRGLAISDGGGDGWIINRGRIEGNVWLGDGNDIFDGRKGTMQGVVHGGGGHDSYVVDGKLAIVETFDGGQDTVTTTVSFTLPDFIETLVLSGTGNINGKGSDQVNTIFGNSGGNRIDGMGGNDHLRGAEGNDFLTGGSGADEFMVFVGEGIDTITDFTDDEDHIGIYNFGFEDFSDLTLVQNDKTGGNVWIQLGRGHRIVIEGIDMSVLDNADFYFI